MKENKDLKILVTGGSGLVGKHLKDILPNATYLSSKDADLTRINEVYGLIVKYKPDVGVPSPHNVILLSTESCIFFIKADTKWLLCSVYLSYSPYKLQGIK